MASRVFETFVRPTREYVGGALAGIGLGIIIATSLRLAWGAPVSIAAFGLIAIGGFLGWSGQKRFREQTDGHS